MLTGAASKLDGKGGMNFGKEANDTEDFLHLTANEASA